MDNTNPLDAILASVKPTMHEKPIRAVIHGDHGVGKSTFCSQAPNPIFLRTEDGLAGIDTNALPVCSDLETFMNQLAAIEQGRHDFKSLVVDSADWLERLIHEYVCKQHNVKTVEAAAGGYGKGYQEALNYWREILNTLDRISANRGMVILLICHSKLVTVADPEFEDYDKYKLKLHTPKSGNGSQDVLLEWADLVGFAKIRYSVGGGEVVKSEVKKFKGNVASDRVLCVTETPAYVAKNRYRLTNEIPLSYQSLIDAIKQSTINNQEGA